jgi:hypothetical protein
MFDRILDGCIDLLLHRTVFRKAASHRESPLIVVKAPASLANLEDFGDTHQNPAILGEIDGCPHLSAWTGAAQANTIEIRRPSSGE